MGKADIAVKNWLSDKRRFADLFNGMIFEGKEVILPNELEDMDRETDIIMTDKTGKERGFQRFRDLVKRWNQEIILAVLACEVQDKTHYAMPVRNMLQDGISYTDQIRGLWRSRGYGNTSKENEWREGKSRQETEKLTAEEYLSRFRKTDRIYPVITLVFYYDVKKWDGAVELYDLFGINKASVKEITTIKKYIPNYKINLIDAGRVADITRFHTDLQQVFGMLKYREDKENLKSYMQKKRDYFGQVDVETYQALGVFLRSENKLKEIMDPGEEERIDMCKALDDIYEDGVKDGERTGKIAGRKEGREAGREEGRAFIISRMLKNGLEMTEIKKYTEATDQEIERVKESMQ